MKALEAPGSSGSPSPRKGFARWHGDGAPAGVPTTGAGCYRLLGQGSLQIERSFAHTPLRHAPDHGCKWRENVHKLTCSMSRDILSVLMVSAPAPRGVAVAVGGYGCIWCLCASWSRFGRKNQDKRNRNWTRSFAVESRRSPFSTGAVVLFTPDDVGGPADESASMRPRPRQNVVYELGFFSAKLGHRNVCVLYSDGVEIPSDLSGVIFIPFDNSGAWNLRLAKEMKGAGIEIDMNQVI